MASTYNKFGRLIRIDGSTQSVASNAWTNYKSAAVRQNGNIVFADLRGGHGDSSVLNPAGMYIWANGMEYKVADLETFNIRYNEFTQYVTDNDASVDELQRWRSALTFNTSGSTNNVTVKILDGANKGILGDVDFTGGEYIKITPTTGADGVINVSIDNSMIARATGERDTGNYRKLTTKGYVDTSIDTVNSSISNISTRVANVINHVHMEATGKYNDVSVGLYQAKENHGGATVWEYTGEYHIKGDGTYIITNGGTANEDVTITLGVNNASIDNGSKDASISTTGAIRSYVDRKVQGLTGALRFMGSVNSSAALDNVRKNKQPSGSGYVDSSKGCLWVSNASFNYTLPVDGGESTIFVEPGDQIILTADASKSPSVVESPITVVERNLDGAVTAGSRSFQEGRLIVGNTDGKQDVKDSGYTVRAANAAGTNDGDLDSDTSTNMKNSTKRLATEKAVANYVEGQFDKLDIAVNSSNNTYFHIKKTKKRTDLATFESIEAGVGTATYNAATAAATTGTAGTTLADANTFKKAISSIGAAVGLTDGTDTFDPNWNSTIQTDLSIGKSNDIVDTIEKLDASVTLYINKMEVPNTDTANRILVGIEQHKGVVSSTSAILKINGVSYTHTKGDGIVTATIDGTNIKVGGTTAWKNSSINKAIEDISNGFISNVVGESKFAPVSKTTISADYVRVESNKTSTNNNTYTLNTSLRLANHVTIPSGASAATDTGLATDGYVKDYVQSILEWETIS
ncbi:MAG: hypothetical protein [Wendovervirus sonii]|uniref:Tail fiber protein n=1 Tax=phage Lak_Megaphage_Sonny TaxID=3109229 RepID=A0ABZ0Z5H0_9CAUD|nr:MAG: hypothetical protein [phage Lak_Megaphage_Sonny]